MEFLNLKYGTVGKTNDIKAFEYQYAFYEGGAHLPIANALRLPEPTNKTKNLWAVPLRFAPVIWLPEDLEVRGRKEERKNNAKFSGHYVRPRTHKVYVHALRSHQLECNWTSIRWVYFSGEPSFSDRL